MTPLALFVALAAVTLGAAASDDQAPLRYGSWGVDLDARDLTVKPGDEFFRYASGQYFATTSFPPDQAWIGVWDRLSRKTRADLQAIITGLPKNAPAGSAEQKVADYYHAYLDVATLEQRGLAPLKPLFAAIAKARTHEDLARLMARPGLMLSSPVSTAIGIDEKNPDRYVVTVQGDGGLGLPNRDYYLKDDKNFQDTRAQYRAHIARLLALSAETAVDEQAAAVLELETALAAHQWPREKLRERELTYNPRTRKELEKLTPGFPWEAYLEAQGLGERQDFILGALEPLQGAAAVFLQTPVRTWQSYHKYHLLADAASVLPEAFDAEAFDFHGKTLNGQPARSERWKRAVDATNGALGDVVGQLYVKRHFPPESKQKMLLLVENLRQAFKLRLQQVTWMSEPTRQVALEKLAAFRPKIGYPDKWRDYSALQVIPGDAFGNRQRVAVFEWQRDLERLDKPTDRSEWFTTPQTVNAYYDPTFNEILFPAAFLQPPFFDPNADDAVNYGAIGTVIGHEMGHGFDDQGAKSDAKGVLRSWWQPQDEAAFKALGDRLATQFDQYEVFPGLNVRGRLVLGENIADLAGLRVAYDAYQAATKGTSPKILDGLSPEQRFFLAFAQCWRVKFRDERLRSFVMNDPHSPPQFRVNGILRNLEEWHTAFDVKPGDALYLPPAERVTIW